MTFKKASNTGVKEFLKCHSTANNLANLLAMRAFDFPFG